MIFALILAGGIGSRMGDTTKPKQFLKLGSKPILIHTLEKFFINSKIDEIIVLTLKDYILYTEDLINKFFPKNDIKVIEGGKLRIDTINNGMEYILENYNNNEEHIIVTHDAVRPFVSHRIIEENINLAKETGACNTMINSTDTIVESKNSKIITNIPQRDFMYQGQTPQTFELKKLKKYYDKLTNEDKIKLSDACKLFIINNDSVSIVKGDVTNMKITHTYDLKVANFILNGG